MKKILVLLVIGSFFIACNQSKRRAPKLTQLIPEHTEVVLQINNKATFIKKATGRITFSCEQGLAIDEAIKNAIDSGEGQTVWLHAKGLNQEGIIVSEFSFEWTLKVRNKKL